MTLFDILTKDFKQLEEVIFDFYNISDSFHQERIIQTADGHGFKIFWLRM